MFLLGVFLLNHALTDSWTIKTGDESIWFNGGLFMLIVGAYWIEHFFTKPSDVIVNCLAVFIAVSSLNNPPFAGWWRLVRYGSMFLMIGAFVVVWSGSPAIAKDTSMWKRVLYGMVIRAGNASVLFSVVFILALLSYFDLQRPELRWAVIFWGIVLSARHLDLDGFIRYLSDCRMTAHVEIAGVITRFAEPNIVRFQVVGRTACPKGSLVTFSKGVSPDQSCPLGIVIGHRSTADWLEAEALIVSSRFEDGAPLKNRFAILLDRNDTAVQKRLATSMLGWTLDRLLGFASRGSDVARLYFEIVNTSEIEEGQLISIPLASNKSLLFQIINGRLHEETTLDSGERAFTIAEAEQVGTWNEAKQGFETHSWVVSENAPVLHVGEAVPAKQVRQGLVEIGTVPSSAYPVNINLRDLLLYHSAILGVTGSGKSYLAYQLIESCAAIGTKVLCLDVTGDYKRYLRNSVLIKRSGEVKGFLDSTEGIGIVEFTEASHPIKTANMIADIALNWCRERRSPQEVKEPVPKLLLVLEEAHTLVPEWNWNPDKSLQELVNKTAQIALQARKYGLGFMLITQRTANVTKSILNQCNTIFAFQAYDETGFDFMKNYMGEHYVQALPNLKKRQGVLVGKASVSDRPLIVRFDDQKREPTNQSAREFAATSTTLPLTSSP
jgi:hypothetical protein